MKSIQVNLDKRSYSIDIESGILKKCSSLLNEHNNGQKWIIISQYNLMELFGFSFLKELKKNNFDVDFITLPNGETAKSINEYSRIINQMIEYGVAKECARMVLPLCTPTRLYMTGSCRSWVHYINLRSAHGTQKEHMDIAEACRKVFTEQFPTVSEALEWV